MLPTRSHALSGTIDRWVEDCFGITSSKALSGAIDMLVKDCFGQLQAMLCRVRARNVSLRGHSRSCQTGIGWRHLEQH
eukprot:364937-Chlamydomonas_euryale.AAC.5